MKLRRWLFKRIPRDLSLSIYIYIYISSIFLGRSYKLHLVSTQNYWWSSNTAVPCVRTSRMGGKWLYSNFLWSVASRLCSKHIVSLCSSCIAFTTNALLNSRWCSHAFVLTRLYGLEESPFYFIGETRFPDKYRELALTWLYNRLNIIPLLYKLFSWAHDFKFWSLKF